MAVKKYALSSVLLLSACMLFVGCGANTATAAPNESEAVLESHTQEAAAAQGDTAQEYKRRPQLGKSWEELLTPSEEEVVPREEYFSQIRDEMRGKAGNYWTSYEISDSGNELLEIHSEDDSKSVIYQTDGRLDALYCGRGIVIFTEELTDGTWRVLRLYRPDGTVDMLEEGLSEILRIDVLNNCEFVTTWENPAYTEAVEAHSESIWNQLNTTMPYPTTEEEKWLPGNEHFFHDVLPLEIYKTYGIFDRYVRYRNTLTGKTVTLGCTRYSSLFYTYILPDGTEWILSPERRVYEDDNYNMVRFWLYLPADE